MAETVAPHLRQEELAAPAVKRPVNAAARGSRLVPALSRPLAALWLVMVGGIAAFLVFGSLRIGTGSWFGRRMPVREIWSGFLGYLREQGASLAIVVLVSILAGLTIVLAAYCLWLALAVQDARAAGSVDHTPDDPV